MAQIYNNLASTTLAAPLAAGATSCTFADGDALGAAPSGGDVQLLFLLDDEFAPTQYEIVLMGARTADAGSSLTRAQEGTSQPASWPAGTVVANRLSAGQIAAMLSNAAGGANSIGAGGIFEITGDGAVGFGYDVYIGSNYCVVLGYGAYVDTGSASGMAFGNGAAVELDSPNGMAIGPSSAVETELTNAMAIGPSSYVVSDYGIAFGSNAVCSIAGTCHIAATPIVHKHVAAMETGAESFRYYSAPQIVLAGQTIDLTETITDDIQTIAIPAGAHFYPDEVHVIIESSNTVTGNPDIAVGTTSGGTELLAATEITATTARNRTVNTAASRHGVTGNITISLKASGAATALTGRVLVYGVLVEDS